ncbi:butyrophilin subfamily 1 member A1-like [Pungitius pungitius]|uniref:butyrophilin subfamily 1 member A1-like n=1 Tax=Pungitius pungitius TaxID=134920 RepID=UPI002E0DA3D0
MGALMMCTCLVAALGAPLCAAAPVSGSLEVLVRTPVSVRRGHTITLPCWYNPPQGADGLEISWYRGNFDSPVMSYRGKRFDNASQDASYVGRVSFGLKDAASAGPTEGDVSLKLEKATVKDAGDYICYVSNERGYDRATVSLTVTEVGTSPILSAAWEEDNMLNVSCESEGWYPKPYLRWSDERQLLQPTTSLRHSEDSSGLQSVHSWLLVTSSSEVSCSVGISDKEPKEARVRLKSPPPSEPKSSPAGWVCFALLLAATVVSLGVLYWKQRSKGKEPTADGKPADETVPLLKTDAEWIPSHRLSEEIKDKYVNVTLQAGNPHLKIKDSLVRDGEGPFPDGDAVTCLTAVTGTPGFSSGKHYWEVSLRQNDAVPLKKSWWVGVTSRADTPLKSDFPPTTSGYWFLSSSPDGLRFNTEPRALLPFSSTLRTIGVSLDHDRGELSFYNVEDGCLISSLTTTFKGDIFPLFNPGKGDQSAMKVLQREEPREEPDMPLSVEWKQMNTPVVQD